MTNLRDTPEQQTADEAAARHVALMLRERIYGGISCLSTLLVLARVGHEESAWVVVFDLLVATVSLWAASLLADLVSHLGAHGVLPKGGELGRVFRASGQILEAAVVPVLLLVLGAVHVFALDTALWAGIWVSVATLGLFAVLAARRTPVGFWGRLAIVVVVLALGGLVVAAKTFVH
jgi:hypothetical protein